MSRLLILLTIRNIWLREDGDELRKKYLICMLKVIAPIEGMRWQWIMSILIGVVLSIPIGLSIETVSIAAESVDIINNLFVAFIAMEVGAYALFQALLSDQLIWELYNKGNLLDESNSSFLGVILLFWAGIMINLVLICLFKVMPEDFLLFKNLLYDNILAIVLLLVYYTMCVRILFEVRNFAINLYKVFVSYNKMVILKRLEANKQEQKTADTQN